MSHTDRHDDDISLQAAVLTKHNGSPFTNKNFVTADPEFNLPSDQYTFVCLVRNRNQKVITWFEKLLYHSFLVRNEKLYLLHV